MKNMRRKLRNQKRKKFIKQNVSIKVRRTKYFKEVLKRCNQNKGYV